MKRLYLLALAIALAIIFWQVRQLAFWTGYVETMEDAAAIAPSPAPPPPAALEPLPPPADLALTPWQQRLTRIFRARDQTAAAAREIDDIMQRMDELHNILGEQLARSSNLMVLAKHQPPQTALATLDRASAISNANPRLQQEYIDLGQQLKALAQLYPRSLIQTDK